MQEIAQGCGLQDSRIGASGGNRVIDVGHVDNTDRKFDCIKGKIRQLNLQTWIHLSGRGAPKLSPAGRRCMEELMKKEGLDGLSKVEKECVSL